jgi:two-component system phosphate regulon sensor histidine kinase PhoR
MTGGDAAGLVLVAALGSAAIGFAVGRRRAPDAPAPAPEVVAQGRDARFEQLLNSITVGVVMLDRRGYVTLLNPAASAILDIGSRPAAGRAMIELLPSFDLDRRVREALAGHPSRGTIALPGPHGERTLTVTALPIDGNDGAIVVATDETRMHELERTRREFVSSVSHELRTPLAAIKLMIETLLDRADDDEARALFLPRMQQEVDRLVQLVQDLLELARSERGQLRLRRSTVDLRTVAESTLHTFDPRASKLGVTLRFTGEATPVDGDEHRLAQVVVNLIDNALKHTRSGGTVTVSAARGTGRAVLTVRDTGTGIPYRDLPHIFERFYVVERSRAREGAGTGLGLSIVKQIVEAHGGTVSAESELGAGSTFTCVFPLA